jgi:hypothetical protein
MLFICGYLPATNNDEHANLPEFREYVSRKYARELDEDVITMIEGLIEHKRANSRDRKGS